MRSLTDKFNELRGILRTGLGAIRHTSFDPVYYLIFPPAEMLRVKQAMPQWEAQLRIDGFDPHQLSMIDVINGYFRRHDLHDEWVTIAQSTGASIEHINTSLTNHLVADKAVERAILGKLAQLKGHRGAVLFLTDLEALHPYLRIGGIEQSLQNQFTSPTVVLYPGIAGGAYSRRFLGIHKEDGNYRSPHID